MKLGEAMKPHLQYAWYIIRHKHFVFKAGLKTGAPIWRLVIHDWSKMTPAEWTAYVNSFYGPQPRTPEVKRAFMDAWRHHIIHNPHHWNHWAIGTSPTAGAGSANSAPRRMPDHFVREMVADWAGAGRAITGRWEIAEWYEKQRETIELHPTTRERVEELLRLFAEDPPR